MLDPRYIEARNTFHDYTRSVLSKRDLDSVLGFLSEEITGFGTAEHEIIQGREQLKKQYTHEFSVVSQPIRYDIILEQFLFPTPDVFVVMARINSIADLPEGPMIRRGFRRTMVWRKEVDRWKLFHTHSSIPERELKPGETYPIEAIREKNLELERLVAQRTAQLEQQAEELKKAQADAEAKAELVEKQNALLLLEIKERQIIEEKLRKSEEELRFLAQTDQLTGAHTRRSLFTYAEDFFQQPDLPISLMILDFDHFKDINDSYGHHVGDQVLRWSVGLMRGALSDKAIFGRLGGEEFVVLLPGQNLQYGLAIAEKLRRLIESSQYETCEGPIQLSISVGVTERQGQDSAFHDLYLRADTALYRAKGLGRNIVQS